MAEQRIAAGPRIAPIPVPQQRTSLLEGADDLIEATEGALRVRDETDRRIAESEARIEERQREEEDAALSAAQGAAFARMQSDIALETEKLRDQGVDGFEDRVRQMVDEKVRQFDAGFGFNEQVRRRFLPNMADLAGRAETSAGLWAIGERAKLGAQQVDGMVREQANALSLSPTPRDYSAAIALTRTALEGQHLPEGVFAKAWSSAVENLTESYVDGLLATGQAAQARALLDAGFFNDKLSDVDRVRSRIGNAEQAVVREAELAQSRARQDANDAADLLRKKVAAGIVPTSAEMAAVRRQAQAAGVKPDDLFDIALLEQQVAVNRNYQGKDISILLRDRSFLDAKVAAGKASEGEQVWAHQLHGLIDAREKETAARYKGLLAQGAAGRVQIVNELQRLPADARFSQAEKVERGLGFVAGLPDADTRAAALNGRQERKANPKLVPPKDLDATFAAAIGGASLGWQGAALNGVRDVAADLYADAVRRTGKGDTFDPKLYQHYLNVALGGSQRRDGTMQGGIGTYGGRKVILPDTKTQDEFAAIVARNPLTMATYDGKTPVQKRDVQRRFTPVYYGELPDGRTRYRFVDKDGRELKGKGGGTYVIEIAR